MHDRYTYTQDKVGPGIAPGEAARWTDGRTKGRALPMSKLTQAIQRHLVGPNVNESAACAMMDQDNDSDEVPDLVDHVQYTHVHELNGANHSSPNTQDTSELAVNSGNKDTAPPPAKRRAVVREGAAEAIGLGITGTADSFELLSPISGVRCQ